MTLTTVNNALQGLPYNTSLVSEVDDKDFSSDIGKRFGKKEPLNKKFQVNYPWEGFFRSIQLAAAGLINRELPSILLNSDFNILSTNGTTPVTPAQGSNYEVIKQWFLVNGGGTNSYTLTPTAYSNVPEDANLSNYFLNVSITDQNSPLYLYNVNYSQTGKFNSLSQFNSVPVTFSFAANNNTENPVAVWFTVYFSNTAQELSSKVAYLPAGYTNSAVSLAAIDLTGVGYSPADYAQIRCYVQQVNGDPVDLDINYLKAELADTASYLAINPVLEQFICNNLS